LSPNGQYTELRHLGCLTGGEAWAGVVLDAAGNLYGTTEVTPPDCDNGNGPSPFGVVYELDPGGKLTVLYRFPGPPELLNNVDTGPNPGVILDSTGNVYGATPYSGVGGPHRLSASPSRRACRARSSVLRSVVSLGASPVRAWAS
jgi:hypothetical protein